MTWNEARAVAGEVHAGLARRFDHPEVRLILRALSRLHHTSKDTSNMQVPSIIISEPSPGSFQIDVSGRFGGGFRGLRTDRAGVLSRLALLKSYDCGEEPASVIVPDSLLEECGKVFPQLRE